MLESVRESWRVLERIRECQRGLESVREYWRVLEGIREHSRGL